MKELHKEWKEWPHLTMGKIQLKLTQHNSEKELRHSGIELHLKHTTTATTWVTTNTEKENKTVPVIIFLRIKWDI